MQASEPLHNMKPTRPHTALTKHTSAQQAQGDYLRDSDDLLYAFLVRHKAPSTNATYRRAISAFFGTDRVTLAMAHGVSDEMLNHHIVNLETERGPASAKTKALHLSAIRGFYGWLKKKRLILGDDNPVEGDIVTIKVNRGENPVAFLSAHQVRALLRATDSHGEAATRDRCMIEVLVRTGLRCSELAAVRVEHFVKQGEYDVLLIPEAKGGENQSVKCSPEVMRALSDMKAVYGIDSGYLFVSMSNRSRGQRMSRNAVYNAVKRTMKEAGLEGAVHTLRHTYATLALEGGANIRQVQTGLRHAKIETSMIYVHQRDKLADSAVDYVHI